jgi:hypothetical protein
MKYDFWRYLFLIIGIFMSIQPSLAQEKQEDGVLFELTKRNETDARWMKIQICTENIIRIITSQEKPFSTRQSLMVAKTTWESVPWTVTEKGDKVEISTSKLTVRVNTKSGAVASECRDELQRERC